MLILPVFAQAAENTPLYDTGSLYDHDMIVTEADIESENLLERAEDYKEEGLNTLQYRKDNGTVISYQYAYNV